MVTINTIEDLARILREQPTWADTLRALLLTEDLLDLPARFDRFMQSQEETNRRLSEFLADTRQQVGQLMEAHDETNQKATNLEVRFNRMEGRFANFEGAQYEGMVRTKALARAHIQLGFESPYVALHQEGLTDPRLTSAIAQALRESPLAQEDFSSLFEADLIISAEGNRHAVIEVSLSADDNDIRRARQRANILETVTGGSATPVVITARIDDARYDLANEERVMVFIVPYP